MTKKVLFLLLATVAVLMSSCSADKYKNYIPQDSKVIAKIDFAQFVKQSGVDVDKLAKDIEQEYGKDSLNLKESGISLESPVYIFADSKGEDAFFGGAVLKVSDAKKAQAWIEKQSKKKMTEGSDKSLQIVADEAALAIKDDALVVTFSSDKKPGDQLNKILANGEKNKVEENELFKKAEASPSFASFFMNCAIVPKEAFEQGGEESADEVLKKLGLSVDDLRSSFASYEATVEDGGVLKITSDSWATSKNMQKHMDDLKGCLGKITDDGLAQIPGDGIGALALNVNGEKLVALVLDMVKKFIPQDNPEEAKQGMDQIAQMLEPVKGLNGNIVVSGDIEKQSAFVLGKGKDLSETLKQLIGGLAGENAEGLNIGYKDGFNFVALGEGDPFAKPAKPLDAKVAAQLKNSPTALFVNINSAVDFASKQAPEDQDIAKAKKAFAEVLSKIHYAMICSK